MSRKESSIMSKSNLIRLAACLIPAIIIWLLPLSIFGTEFVVTEQRMLAIFIMAALMWILEPVPAWVTSTFSILVMLFTVSTGGIGPLVEGIDEKHIVSYQSLLGSYADPIIILFLGGFVIFSSNPCTVFCRMCVPCCSAYAASFRQYSSLRCSDRHTLLGVWRVYSTDYPALFHNAAVGF